MYHSYCCHLKVICAQQLRIKFVSTHLVMITVLVAKAIISKQQLSCSIPGLWSSGSCNLHCSLPVSHEQHRRQLARHRRPHLEGHRLQGGTLPCLARLDRGQRRSLLHRLSSSALCITSKSRGMRWNKLTWFKFVRVFPGFILTHLQ